MFWSFEKLLRKAGKLKLLFPAFFAALLPFFLNAAPPTSTPRGQYHDPNVTAIREMNASIEEIRHEVNNHEAEIHMHDEKLKNMDSIIENVREQMEDAVKFTKEQLKNCLAGTDAKIVSLDNVSKSIVNDLRVFKTHLNETSTILSQYKQKMDQMEKVIDHQNQNIEHLQAAMHSLMEALQGKTQPLIKPESDSFSGSGFSYKVKQGDSLEKIARSHQVTIQAIKEANGLTSDRIVVGKTLIIPEK